MRIERIHITNWRSIRETEILFKDFLMLTGKNNHGKSNILCAFLYFFGRLEPEIGDYYNGSRTLAVEMSFRDLNNKEVQLFKSSGNAIVLRKQSDTKNGKTVFVCNGNEITDEQQEYLIHKFAEIIFIPASRQSMEAINLNGENPFHQLLRVMAAAALMTPDQAVQETEMVFSSPEFEKTEKLNIILHALQEEMQDWDVQITFPDQGEGKTDKKLDIRFQIKDGVGPNLARKGHGFQRAIFFAIIRAWAKLLESGFRVSANDVPEEIILLYEEPELFLHPQAQRELLSSLKTLTESGVRIMLTTHSSFFVDLSRYQSIGIVQRKNFEEGSIVRQATEDLFLLHEEVRNFNMNYWINPDRGELFFARKVLLVEGPTEKVILPRLAKKAGVFRHEDTIIDCGGKSNMPMYIALLNRFGISYVVAYDSDQHKYRNHHSRETARMHTDMIERHIDHNIGSSVVFVNDIEEELALFDTDRKHKPFTALQYISSDKFELSSRLLMKLLRLYE